MGSIQTVLVGLGDIHKYHAQALLHVPEIEIIGAYDIDPERSALINAPKHYSTAEQLYSEIKYNAAIVAVSTPNHFDVASTLLNKGVSVLLEKPAVMDMNELYKLYDIAAKNNAILIVALHDAFGQEIKVFLTQHLENLLKIHGHIKKVESHYYDPYCSAGIDWGRVHSLVGSWLDSGINALSVHGSIIGPMLLDKARFDNLNGNDTIEIGSSVTLTYVNKKGLNGSIITSWKEPKKSKKTTIVFEDGYRVILDHSKQAIEFQAKAFSSQLVWSNSDTRPRLVQQYIYVFKDFVERVNNNSDNRIITISLHGVLLKAWEKFRRDNHGEKQI